MRLTHEDLVLESRQNAAGQWIVVFADANEAVVLDHDGLRWLATAAIPAVLSEAPANLPHERNR